MVREIISIPRADSGHPHNFMVDSWVFKDDESESEAETKSGPRVCPLLVESPHFTHTQIYILYIYIYIYIYIYNYSRSPGKLAFKFSSKILTRFF